jgi:phosphoglycolate phosphatase-like HAD superfamily hydrolase
VLPGVHELVAALSVVPGVSMGVATGNFRPAARLKLDHFGLSAVFHEGGYGEDSADRAEVVALAAGRIFDRMEVDAASAGPVVIVGDTPFDVEAAHGNGFLAAAVATGFSSYDDLADSGADLVFESFEDREPAFLALLGLAGIQLG